VVGVGTSGSVSDGEQFRTDTGLTTATLLWDDTAQIWAHYDVFSMPTAVLVDASGNLVYELPGVFSPDEVLSRL
jgi:thioredoxin-related protein